MDTSVKNLISMGPLEDYFIYYDLKNQVFSFWDHSPCQIYPTQHEDR